MIVYLTAKDNYLPNMRRPPDSAKFKALRRIYDVTLDLLGSANVDDDEESSRRNVLGLARSAPILFALDNLESLEEGEFEGVVQFLSSLDRPSRAIVTSRLNRRQGKTIELKGLTNVAAKQLLLSRIGLSEVDLSVEDSRDVERLIGYTEGFPLALLFVANNINSGYSIGEAADHLRGRPMLELLKFSFESSVSHLDDDQLRILYYLSVSSYPRSRDDLLGLLPDRERLGEAIGRFTEMSLIQRSGEDPTKTRFSVNSLVADFVRQWAQDHMQVSTRSKLERRAGVEPSDIVSKSAAVEIRRAIAQAKAVGSDWQRAIEILETARTDWGDDPELSHSLGYCYYRLEQRAKARTYLENALALGCDTPDCHFHLSLVLYYDRDHAHSLEHAEIALALRSPYPRADLVAGQCLLSQAQRGMFMLSTDVRRGLLEKSRAHFAHSVIPNAVSRQDTQLNEDAKRFLERVDMELGYSQSTLR
jgi:tetratricopeptide (TPR) repeat protein